MAMHAEGVPKPGLPSAFSCPDDGRGLSNKDFHLQKNKKYLFYKKRLVLF